MLSGRQTRDGSGKPRVRPTWRPANLPGRRGAFVPDTPWSMNAPTLRARQTQPIACSGGGGRHTSAMWAVAAITVATHTHTHTRLTTSFSRATWVSRYQKGKTSLDLNEARDGVVWGCSGISWTVYKQSAPRCRQITTPTPYCSIFTDQMLFLTPN